MKLLIIGDSFVEGVGATGKRGWAQLLSESVKPSTHVTISGFGGNTIRDILSRVPTLLPQEFDVILLEIGINDSRHRPSRNDVEVPLKEFMDGLRTFVRAFIDVNPLAAVYFLGLTRVDEQRTAPYKEDKWHLNRDIEVYSDAIAKAARASGARFVPLPPLADDPGSLADGLHPSDRGHRAILNAVLAEMARNGVTL